MCARSCSIRMEFNSYKLLKRNTLIHPIEFGRQIRPSSPILGPHSKSFQSFHSCLDSTQGTLAQVFPCEFCEISRNIFFTEHLWTTASEAFQNKKRNEENELCFFLKKHIPILLGYYWWVQQPASVYWYFPEYFLALSHHFFSKSKDRVLGKLRVSFNQLQKISYIFIASKCIANRRIF